MKTYSTDEVAKILQTNKDKIYLLQRYKLLNGTKIGKRTIFAEEEVKRFLEDTQGADLSNEYEIEMYVAYQNSHTK